MKAWETTPDQVLWLLPRTVAVIVHDNSLTENYLAAVTNNTNNKFHF